MIEKPVRVETYRLTSNEVRAGVFKADGELLCEHIAPEDAEEIARALNSHEELVAALRNLLALHVLHHNNPFHAEARALLAAQEDK